jgi:hypothetical protein
MSRHLKTGRAIGALPIQALRSPWPRNGALCCGGIKSGNRYERLAFIFVDVPQFKLFWVELEDMVGHVPRARLRQ